MEKKVIMGGGKNLKKNIKISGISQRMFKSEGEENDDDRNINNIHNIINSEGGVEGLGDIIIDNKSEGKIKKMKFGKKYEREFNFHFEDNGTDGKNKILVKISSSQKDDNLNNINIINNIHINNEMIEKKNQNDFNGKLIEDKGEKDKEEKNENEIDNNTNEIKNEEDIIISGNEKSLVKESEDTIVDTSKNCCIDKECNDTSAKEEKKDVQNDEKIDEEKENNK